MSGDDPIDAAIAATSAPDPIPYTMVELTLNASGGRAVTLGLPLDLSESELIELMGWLGTTARSHLVNVAATTPRLEVARAMPGTLRRQ